MADPLEALRGAQSIRDPYADLEVMGAMPMPPWGAGMRAAVQAGGKVVPAAARALRGLLGASERGSGELLGTHLPDFTPVGGEAEFNAGRVGNAIAGNPAINPASENAFNQYANHAPSTFVKPSAMPEPPPPPPFRQVHNPPTLQGKPNQIAVDELLGELKGNLDQVPRSLRGTLGSETGALNVTPEQMIGGAGAAGLAAYGVPKAYQALKSLGSSLNEQYNPFQQWNRAVSK